jgi:hypothetical protein
MSRMAEQPRGRKLRVTLDRVQILESKEPFFKPYGEVRLHTRVSTRDYGGTVVETTAPEKGAFRVSAHAGKNMVELEVPIFEGWVDDHLEVELSAVEVDRFSHDETYQTYRRIHRGTGGLTGRFGPGDEVLDTEDMPDWRVWYRIEEV